MEKNGKEFNQKLKNTAKLNWQSKPRIEPEPKDLEFQNAEIVYPNVELKHGKLSHFIEDATESNKIEEQPNRLIWGDNLLIMQALLAQGYEGKIDLIYIDPPFNTGQDFNFSNKVVLPTQDEYDKEWTMIERLAYTDTWERDLDSFLDMLYPRLKVIHRLLSPKGLLFFHCDDNVVHYVKILLDEIFGKNNFRNEIIWQRCNTHNDSKRFGRVHDTILFYSKSSHYTWNPQFIEYRDEYVESAYRYTDEKGRYRLLPLQAKGGPSTPKYFGKKLLTPPKGTHWRWDQERINKGIESGLIILSKNDIPAYKQYLDEMPGVPLQSIWTDIKQLPLSELSDYPTQKPLELLRRIVLSSTNEGDLVADFFNGSGTTTVAASDTKRRWIGCDLSKMALHISRNRLLINNIDSSFLIQNLGNYQRHLIYTQGFNIKKANSLIFKLYKAKQRDDLIDIGIKEDEKNALVFVSYPDRHLTAKTVLEKVKEIQDLDGGIYKKLIVLAWDYEIQFDENLKKLSELDEYKTKIQIETKLIPADIYNYLKKIDESKEDEINKLRDRIHFYDKPYLKLSKPKIMQNFGSEALVRLEIERYNILDFPIKDEDKKSKLLEACKNNFAILIDYYSVDWDYDMELFKSQTQVMAGFGKKRQIVNTIVENRLKKGKKYNIVMRLVDIFGNDSETRTEIDLR